MTVRATWFTRKRYGSPVAVAGSVVAFSVLLIFAGYTISEAAYLVSQGGCFGNTGQLPTCPARGPDWARPLPGVSAFVGLFTGLAGLLAGRPGRAPALITGFLMTAASLAGSWLMSPT